MEVVWLALDAEYHIQHVFIHTYLFLVTRKCRSFILCSITYISPISTPQPLICVSAAAFLQYLACLVLLSTKRPVAIIGKNAVGIRYLELIVLIEANIFFLTLLVIMPGQLHF